MQFGRFPRFRLAHAPTPLEPLARISAALGGPQLFIKRDDCTGLATGGNKTRKLEFLIGAALAEGATDVVTEGGLQSNHVRQTAAASARAGLSCHLVLARNVPGRAPVYARSGNLLLDHLLGATLHVCAAGETRAERASRLTDELRRAGRRPYQIPTGGSNGLGALGYAALAAELVQQANERGLSFDHAVVASSSGGTQAGLIVGMQAIHAGIRVLGVDIEDEPEHLTALVTKISAECAALLGLPRPVAADAVEILRGHGAPGYGQPNAAMKEAVTMMARQEGILLDPVYSGKAFAGLLAEIARGRFTASDRVVFIHTGGTPALFAYADEFLPREFP